MAQHPLVRQRGFTLIELLVALAVMALLAIVSWRGLDGMVRAQEQTRQRGDELLVLQAALAQWGADLDAVLPLAHTVPLDWDGQVLRITRRSSAVPDPGALVVAWARRNVQGQSQWLRWQSPPVMSQNAWRTAWENAGIWSQAANEDRGVAGGPQAVRVANATEWQLHYFRQNAWTNPLSSGAQGATATDTLPDGIRLMVTLAPGQAINGPMVIDWVRPNFGGAS